MYSDCAICLFKPSHDLHILGYSSKSCLHFLATSEVSPLEAPLVPATLAFIISQRDNNLSLLGAFARPVPCIWSTHMLTFPLIIHTHCPQLK